MTAPECRIRGCTAWRVDPHAYCAGHIERLRSDQHWIPCHVRDGTTTCALCGTPVTPARHRDRPTIAALEPHPEGTVQLLADGRFIVLPAEDRSVALHDGISLYRSHAPTCAARAQLLEHQQ